MNPRGQRPTMRVIPRLVYNPEKADRGLKAMADILALALQLASRQRTHLGDTLTGAAPTGD